MQRVQTLLAMNVSNIDRFQDSIVIIVNKPLKQFRVGQNSLTIKLLFCKDNPTICPCNVLQQYLLQSKRYHKHTEQLFISYTKSFSSVNKSTISRRIKTILFEAGIDTDYFRIHTTRAAASSAAYDANIHVDHIMKTAG